MGNQSAKKQLIVKIMKSPGWVVQLVEHHPIHQKVVGLIPGQEAYGRQPIDISLSHRYISLSLKLINISSGED